MTLTPAHDLATLESEGVMYHIDSKLGNQNFENLFLAHEAYYSVYCGCAVMRMRSSVWSTHHCIKFALGKKVEEKKFQL